MSFVAKGPVPDKPFRTGHLAPTRSASSASTLPSGNQGSSLGILSRNVHLPASLGPSAGGVAARPRLHSLTDQAIRDFLDQEGKYQLDRVNAGLPRAPLHHLIDPRLLRCGLLSDFVCQYTGKTLPDLSNGDMFPSFQPPRSGQTAVPTPPSNAENWASLLRLALVNFMEPAASTSTVPSPKPAAEPLGYLRSALVVNGLAGSPVHADGTIPLDIARDCPLNFLIDSGSTVSAISDIDFNALARAQPCSFHSWPLLSPRKFHTVSASTVLTSTRKIRLDAPLHFADGQLMLIDLELFVVNDLCSGTIIIGRDDMLRHDLPLMPLCEPTSTMAPTTSAAPHRADIAPPMSPVNNINDDGDVACSASSSSAVGPCPGADPSVQTPGDADADLISDGVIDSTPPMQSDHLRLQPAMFPTSTSTSGRPAVTTPAAPMTPAPVASSHPDASLQSLLAAVVIPILFSTIHHSVSSSLLLISSTVKTLSPWTCRHHLKPFDPGGDCRSAP